MISDRIIYYSNKDFKSIFDSQNKIINLKKIIAKKKKIVVFRKIINPNILKDIIKSRNNILKRKPFFFKTYKGSKDLYIFNKLNKASIVKGYFRKIELYPWNEKNKKIYSNLKNILAFKCLMENLQFIDLNKNDYYDNSKFLKIQLTNYPPKKGFLTKHVDGIYKTMIVIQIGLTVASKKNKNTGLIFHYDNEQIDIDQHIGIGDIVLYNTITPHEVRPSKVGKGRWSALISSGHFAQSKGTKIQSKEIKS